MNVEHLKLKIPLYALIPLHELYLITLEPDFDKHEDRDEILETLRIMEGVRPEDIKGRFEWK
jgi:hypothetical protein